MAADGRTLEDFGTLRSNKCSGEIDLKFGAVSAEQAANLIVDGFLRPGDEVTPMVFGLLPDDFDEIEFGAVWGV